MSHCLYSTGIWWGHGCGISKLHGRLIRLTSAPDLGGEPLHAVEYVPEVRPIRRAT